MGTLAGVEVLVVVVALVMGLMWGLVAFVINGVSSGVMLSVVMVFTSLVVWAGAVGVSAMSLKSAGSYSSELKVPSAFIWVGMVGKGSGVDASAGVLVAMCDDGVSLL